MTDQHQLADSDYEPQVVVDIDDASQFQRRALHAHDRACALGVWCESELKLQVQKVLQQTSRSYERGESHHQPPTTADKGHHHQQLQLKQLWCATATVRVTLGDLACDVPLYDRVNSLLHHGHQLLHPPHTEPISSENTESEEDSRNFFKARSLEEISYFACKLLRKNPDQYYIAVIKKNTQQRELWSLNATVEDLLGLAPNAVHDATKSLPFTLRLCLAKGCSPTVPQTSAVLPNRRKAETLHRGGGYLKYIKERKRVWVSTYSILVIITAIVTMAIQLPLSTKINTNAIGAQA